MKEHGILEVKTMGGFSLEWEGRRLNIDAKVTDSHFHRLMQILLHNREKGVERRQLQTMLFGDNDSGDVHHRFRSIVYNTRKKLSSEGLPDVNYIIYRKGSYYWTDEIPVREDAEEFEHCVMEAAKETESGRRLELAMKACSLYHGEFLPRQSSLDWVSSEDRRYKQLFRDAIDMAADELRKRGDYATLAELAKEAAKTYPLGEIEVIALEALVAMGRFREAQAYYAEIAELYQKELGIDPSSDIMARLEEIATSFTHARELPDTIMDRIFEGEEARNDCFCTYPVFRGMCRLVRKNKGSGNMTGHILICSLREENPYRMLSESQINKVYHLMDKAISEGVRKCDAVCRYGKGQYLVLLMNIDRANCLLVREDIDRNFGGIVRGCRIEYHLEEL